MVYIIRHGQTDRNRSNVLQGRSDTPLNEAGRAEAKAAGRYFASRGIRFSTCYSSPLDRAVETASLAGGFAWKDILLDDRLLEMDYGPYEGTSLKDPPEEIIRFFKNFVHNPAPEGMEQLDQVVGRVGDFLETLKGQESGNILIATHAIAMKGALEYLTPKSYGSYWSKFIGNCAIYAFDLKDGTFTVPKECIS